MQSEEHLCLIAVIGVERPDKNHRRTWRRQGETEWRLRRVDLAKGDSRNESDICDNREN